MSTQEPEAAVVDTITVQQDVGGPYPVYKTALLLLLSDGSVRWREPASFD